MAIRYIAPGKVLQEISRSISWRAAAALGVSIVADAMDYLVAPILAVPLIGDIPDAIVTAILFAITRSKRSTLINAIEFVPFL